jgi:hypothetical protein
MGFWQSFEDYLWEGKPEFSKMNESYLVSPLTLHIVRFFLMCYTLAIYLWSQIQERSFHHNFQYLTHWGIDFVMVYFLCMMIETIFYYKNNKKQYFYNFSKFNTILFVFGFSSELSIFILFWVGVYPGQKNQLFGVDLFKTINDHGGFLLVVWIENCLNSLRFKKRQVFILLFIIFCYIMVNVGVTFYRDYPVYSVLKYTDGISYGYLAIAILLAVVHFFGNIHFFNKVKFPRLEKLSNNSNNPQYELANRNDQEIIKN